MATMDEISSARKKRIIKTRTRQFGKFVLIIILILLAILAVSSITVTRINDWKDGLRVLFSSGGSYPIATDDSIPIDAELLDGCYTVLAEDGLYTYTNNGKLLMHDVENLANASIKASGKRIILFNQGSKEFDVYSRSEKLYSGILEKTIIDAAITNSGKPLILTDSDRYTAEMTLYSNNDYGEIFTWYCSSGFPYKVFLSENSNVAIVAAAMLSNDGIKTRLYYIDLGACKETGSVDISSLVVDCYIDGNSLVLITDKQYAVLNSKGDVVYTYDFGGVPMISEYHKNGSVSAVALGDNNMMGINTVVVFSSSKHEYLGQITDLNSIDSLYTHRDTVYLLSENTVSEYSSDGVLVKTTEVEDDVSFIFLINSSIVAVLPNYILKY